MKIASDILMAIALGLMTYGVFLIWAPLAWITGGLFLALVAVALHRRSEPK